jgi:phosphatidylserine/phosphatidylglycerophosphate/cardiolipin synthase-like enzyme
LKIDSTSKIYFGGIDQPSGYLRDVLATYIATVPPGGFIDWITYYFRDLKLAQALIRAYKRGVNVTVSLPSMPRICHANDEVIALLSGAGGINEGLRVLNFLGLPAPPGRAWKPQLHEKLYCFSHPKPIAFIGSFNPSGNVQEERSDIIREIGDQDRGCNVLVGLEDPVLVERLVQHARQLHRIPPGLLYRFSANANHVIKGMDTTIYFLPNMRPHPAIQFLKQVSNNAHIRIAASHIRAEWAVNVMINLAKRGVEVEIITDATHRRVTAKAEHRLLAAGIQFDRWYNPDNAPMHLKMVLVEDEGQTWSIYGSFNWTKPSFWLNHEIIAISTNVLLFNSFSNCWNTLKKQMLTKTESICIDD